MVWSRLRRRLDPPDVPLVPADPLTPDEVPVLCDSLDELNRDINRNAGRLPGMAVVNARGVTDTVREILQTAGARPLDVYAVMSVRGILQDYLPTTIKSYLAVDAALVDIARDSMPTPTQSLLEQIQALQTSASATLMAVRARDVDAVTTQGSFLRTKFTGSDLDL